MKRQTHQLRLLYSLLVMIALPLLTLALGGVGWATVCAPGVSPFLELDGNLGFQNSPAASSFDWANTGANPNGCLTSATQTTPIMCGCPNPPCSSTEGGIFDGGKFVNNTTPPKPATLTSAATAAFSAPCATAPGCIAAATFAVDPLKVDSTGLCEGSMTAAEGINCSSNADCSAVPATPTCVPCGSGDPTTYTGMGSEKNGDLITGETWGLVGTTTPKDEISNVYAVAHQTGNVDTSLCTSCTAGGDGCTSTNEIFAGFERVINNGDSHVDLEFLQQPIALVVSTPGTCGGTFSGNRTQGDLLISVDFTTGGTLGTVAVHRWDCGGCPHQCSDDPTKPCFPGDVSKCANPATAQCTNICNPCTVKAKQIPAQYVELIGPDIAVTSQPGLCSNNPQIQCTTANASTVCGSGASCNPFINAITQRINSAGAVGCGGWACRNSDGTLAATAGPPVTSKINTNELYEIGVDLAGIGFTGCISTFLPHTRTSQSFTATLKDFAIIPFNTCAPSTKLTKCVKGPSDTVCGSSTTIETGDSVTYTYTEQNDGNQKLTTPCPSAADKRSCFVTDDTCSGVTYQSGDANNNNILDPGETWTFTCSKTFTCTDSSNMCTVTNIATGHGIFTPPGSGAGLDVTFCDDPNLPPPSTFCDQDEQATATVMVLVPSTRVTKSVKSTAVVTTVVYNYTEKNDGKVALTPPGGTSNRASAMVDTDCTGNGGTMTFVSGDSDNDGVLDPNETWNFACTATYSGTGPFSDTATGHGCFTASGKTRDVTFGTSASACGSGSTVFPDSEEQAKTCVNLTCGACPP